MRNRLLLVIFVICTSQYSSFAQKDTAAHFHRFSLQECVDYGLKHNQQVQEALLDLQIQQQVNRGITSAALPQITGSTGVTYFPDITVQSFPNFIGAAVYGVLEAEGVKNGSGQPIISPPDFGLINAAFGTKWSANAGVSLTQLLFDGQVFVGLQARKTSIDFKRKAIDMTAENIKVNIYKIYYQLVVSKTQLEQFDANIERLEKLLHDTKVLYENGFAEKLDIDKVTVELTNLKTEKASAINQINNGYLGLKVLIGMPIQDTLVLTGKITEDEIKQGLLDEGIYQYGDRNDFQYLMIARSLNKFNIKRYKLTKLPTVALAGNYSKMAQRNEFSFFGKGEWFSSSYIGLNINIPIFSGFAKDANIRQAELELKKTELQLEQLKLTIDNDVAAATNNFNNAVSILDFQKQNMALARSVYDQSKKKYEIGTGSNLEITNAQSDLRVAESNYIQAMYNAIVAKIDYLKAIGKL